jgi:hypothetical protein
MNADFQDAKFIHLSPSPPKAGKVWKNSIFTPTLSLPHQRGRGFLLVFKYIYPLPWRERVG